MEVYLLCDDFKIIVVLKAGGFFGKNIENCVGRNYYLFDLCCLAKMEHVLHIL